MKLMIIGLLTVVALPYFSLAADRDEPLWSAPVNGIRALITMKQSKVVNGTPIIVAHLTLRNDRDIINSVVIPFDSTCLEMSVVNGNGNGKELERAVGPYSGGRRFSADLVLPFDSTMTFNISQSGLGIPKDKQALIDFGPDNSWVIDADDKSQYFLRARLKIEKGSGKARDSWFGELIPPAVLIPTTK